jgi:hypothetical protein
MLGLFRFYTRGVPLSGRFLGLRAGVPRVTDNAGISGEYLVLGAELGRTVGIAGERYELMAGGGAGVNRLIGRDFVGAKWFPALRFNVGLAF